MIKVLYHANCSDGFCSAWIAHKVYPDAEFIPVNYGDVLPKLVSMEIVKKEELEEIGLTGECIKSKPFIQGHNFTLNHDDDVFILDFSYPLTTTIEIYNTVNKLVILDHHETAKKNLKDLPFPLMKTVHFYYGRILPKSIAVFDMDHSGAMLTWIYFFPIQPAPSLAQYVQDRDLWKFNLPYSKEISAILYSYPMTFSFWDQLERRLEFEFESLVSQGKAILIYQEKLVNKIVENSNETEIMGQSAGIVNSPILQSEIGHKLAEKYGIGWVWYQKTLRTTHSSHHKCYTELREVEGLVYKTHQIIHSLRSVGDIDVSIIAKEMGGGGHKNAAGFVEETTICPN